MTARLHPRSVAGVVLAAALALGAEPAVLERGGPHGAQAVSGDVPDVVAEGGRVVAWGMTEVPGDSRLSAALAAVEAVTRSELAQYVAVEVESLMEDRLASDGRRAVRDETRARVQAVLRGEVSVTTGWAKLRRGDAVVLRLVGRTELGAGRLRALVSGLAAGADAPRGDRTGSAVHENAPGWAHRGDGADDRGHRFVCEGEGRTEDEALGVARALCDDKICRLCGVEIEARLETIETLDGVDVQRKIVERCRRVRKSDSPLARRSLDCGADRCRAWILIEYPKSRQEAECRAAAEGDFDDPEACMTAIDGFSKTEGFSAASFRRRVSLLETAAQACANIDVRPTPRLQALDKRLRDGMKTWLTRATPDYLARYWLKPHPPIWEDYEGSPSFGERFEILLGYLRSKPPLLDAIEAALVDDAELDTPAGIEAALDALRRAPLEPGYGVERTYRVLLERVRVLHRRGRLTADVEPIAQWMRSRYPPETTTDWPAVTDLYGLFRADDLISEAEWAYARSIPSTWRLRFLQELLEVEGHAHRGRASQEVRKARFFEALELGLGEKKTPGKAFVGAMPRPAPEFFLAISQDLPAEVSAALEYDELERHLPGLDHFVARRTTERFALYLARHLAEMDAPDCVRLGERLERLEGAGIRLPDMSRAICSCLSRPEASVQSGNDSSLYRRALSERYPCVAPR